MAGELVRIWNTQAPVGQLGLDNELCVRAADGRVLCSVALNVTLYIPEGDRAEIRDGLHQALQRFEALAGQPLTWGMNPTTEEPESLGGSSAFELVQRWPAEVRERFDYQLIFTGGKTPADASPLRFVAVSREREPGQLSFLSLSFPVAWAESHPPEAFVQWVLDLSNLLGPTHGYAGLAALPHVTGYDDQSVRPLFDLARRFQGLDVDLPERHEPFLATRDGIKTVSWLTILGNRWLAQLGGLPALQQRLGQSIEPSQYRDGVILRAGARPEFGDVQSSDALRNYRTVGAALAPLRVKTGMMMRDDSGEGFDLAEAERWQARFD